MLNIWGHTGEVIREVEKHEENKKQRSCERTRFKKRSMLNCAEGKGIMRLK